MKVEEFPWCYRVSGKPNISVADARKALKRSLPGSRRAAVDRMPFRPAWFPDLGSAVVFYFSVFPGAEQKYKP